MADESDDKNLLERILPVVGVLIAGLTILRFGRGLFVKRFPGPIMRLLYRRVPRSKIVISSTIGDVPLAHAEHESFAHALESAITIGFWAAYKTDQHVHETVDFISHGAVDNFKNSILNFFYADPLSTDARYALLDTDKSATVEDDGTATVITSANGLVQVGVLDAWSIDP